MAEVHTQYEAKDGKTYKIEYDDRSNTWRAEMDDEYILAPSLNEVKIKLDRKTSPKARNRRIPAIVSNGYSFAYGHATSILDGGYQVRVSYANSKREMVPRTRVFADTPENRVVCEQINELTKQSQALNAEIRAKQTTMLPFDLKQLEDE